MPVWNPWHGCHKISTGCLNCYMFRGDKQRGLAHRSEHIHKTSMFDMPLRMDRHGNWKYPEGTHFWLCFTSDLFIEEADSIRGDIWMMIRRRPDCHFTFLTKRIDRFEQCLPRDWGEGFDNVTIGCTVENQDRADYRLPIFLKMPARHRIIMAEPLLTPIDLSRYLDPTLIEGVSVGGESGRDARPIDFDWVKSIYLQCRRADIPFDFHQTGANFIKDNRHYSIPRHLQEPQAKKAMAILETL